MGFLPRQRQDVSQPGGPYDQQPARRDGHRQLCGERSGLHRKPRVPRTFLDGTSYTLAFAEHYAGNCHKSQFYFALAEAIPHIHRATFADGGPLVNSFVNDGDAYPVTEGNPPTSEGALNATFQVAPNPDAECDPRLANTPHRSGMLVALGDGSVRTLAPGISPAAYWGAVTPASGDVLGQDW